MYIIEKVAKTKKKQLMCPSIDWIKMWYIYIIEFAETHDEILPFTKTWLES